MTQSIDESLAKKGVYLQLIFRSVMLSHTFIIEFVYKNLEIHFPFQTRFTKNGKESMHNELKLERLIPLYQLHSS